jgi:Mu-like prophage major head subunit gpT
MAHTLRINGVTLRSESPSEIYRSAMMTRAAPGFHTTSDFPGILSDTMNRRLGELFRVADTGLTAIAATGTARDFRPVKESRLTSFPSLEPVNEAGEIKWGTLSEEGETLAISSYARAIAVSFQLLVNDDLGAIERSIRDVAFATASRKRKVLLAALTAVLSDGKALFHLDHSNLASSGAPPDETTLDAARTAMLRQTAPDSDEPLGLVPAIILVPPELQVVVEKLIATITPATTSDVNPFAGRLQIAVEPGLSDAKQWFLFAAPGTYPVIRFLTLAGYEAPRFETSQEFDRLGSSYRVHWHVGAGPVDYRGAFKNAGQ